MLRTNETSKPGVAFEPEFAACLAASSSTDICVGYCSRDTVRKYRARMIKAAGRGRLRLIIGMYSSQGNFPPKLYRVLVDLHQALAKASPGSGVFVTTCDYHGKIYLFDALLPEGGGHPETAGAWLGSSNFSPAGLCGRREAIVRLADPADVREAAAYVEYLCSRKAVPVTGVTLTKPPESARETLFRMKPAKSLPASLVPDGSMEIDLNVARQAESGLNLCKGAGRKTRLKYTPRDWYEVEISCDIKARRNPLYPKTDNAPHQKRNAFQKTSNHCEFDAYLTDGTHYWSCRLSTYSDGYKAMGSKPRTLLGEFMKGMLEQCGLLKRGETITQEMLEDYGRTTVTLTRYTDTARTPDPEGKLRDKVFVLSFERPADAGSWQDDGQEADEE